MGKKEINRIFDTWTTDDELVLFQFTIIFYDDGLYPEVNIQVFYVEKYTSNRLLCWTGNQMPLLEAVELEYNVTRYQYRIWGTLTIKIEASERHKHLIVWADIKHGTHYPYNEFLGPIYFLELQPGPPDPDPPGPFPPGPYPPGPIPPGPIPPDDPDFPVVKGQDHDLFPFTYMHPWPEPDETETTLNFIFYSATYSSPPGSTFYSTLSSLKASGDRAGMQAAAIDFIENSGIFVKSVLLLPNPVDCFNNSVITTINNNLYQDFVAIVCIEASITPENLTDFLITAEYAEIKENLWLSYFALVILVGYRNKLVNDISRTLQACHALENLLLNSPPPLLMENYMAIRMLLHASIVLPDDIFPVPFATTIENTGTVAPYAIGDLQLVRQRLIRYEAGEVANIINVMPGEKKSIERRKLNQYSQKIVESAENKNAYTDYEEENDEDFEKEVSKTLSDYKKTYDYQNLNNTYGAPTNITIDGTYSIERNGEKPELKDITTFAKKILNSTTRRVAEKVYRSRQQNTKNEYEESETSKFENKSETKSLLGIYYWLNKIYLAQVINYGNRFMLSFTVPEPAKKYIIQTYNLAGSYLVEPQAPAQFGIYTFNDITPDNYAQLCSYYRVQEYSPPPPATVVVTESLVGNENKQVKIIAGYYASTAILTYILSQGAGDFSVQCLLGKNQLSIDHPQSDTVTVSMNNENTSVPFSASFFYTLASPPETPASFIINTEITCLLAEGRLDEWKIDLHRKITDAYEKMRAEYYNNFSAKNPDSETANPAKNRITVRNELKKQCILVLMEYAGLNLFEGDKSTISNTQSPPANVPDYPRYEQFFNQAFDWDEMTYTFIESYSPTGKTINTAVFSSSDNFFTAFLQAEGARIYLSARPSFNFRITFFLATGAIWTADEYLAPLLTAQITLVSELKRIFRMPHPRVEKILESWEVAVPTSLQILNREVNKTITIL